jgi:hypothetical membrane protein
MAGSVLLSVVWLVESALRPGYDPVRQWVSQLALTGRGWVMTAAFLLSGALIVAFGLVLGRAVRTGPASTWGPRWVVVAGAGLVAAGLFPIDPGLGYPVGVPETRSWHGALHDAAGLMVFVGLAVAALVWSRRWGGRAARLAGVAVLVLWLLAGVLAGLDYGAVWRPAPAGLAERAALLVGCAWLAGLSVAAAGGGPGRRAGRVGEHA